MADVQVPIVVKATKIQERRDAILKLLSADKVQAINKEEIYTKLTRKHPHFAAEKYDHVEDDEKKKADKDRYKYRTLVRDLEYLCLIGKIAFFKDGAGMQKGEQNKYAGKSPGMYSNDILTQISNEEWCEYSKNIVLAKDKNESGAKKSAEIELKNRIIEIVKRTEKDLVKNLSRYRAAWRGGWRYFKLEEEVYISADFAEETAFHGQFSGENFQFLKTLEGKLPTETLHGRVLAKTETYYQPKRIFLDGMRIICRAILNRNKVTFYLPPSPGNSKNTRVTANPLGITNKNGVYIFVAHLIVGNRWECKHFYLSDMRDVKESEPCSSDQFSESEIKTMLAECLSYTWLTESVERISLFLHKSAAYKFQQFASFVQQNIEFTWIDRINEVAKVSFEARINEQLVEDLVSMGGNVIVEGSEKLKRCVKQYQMPSNSFEEILQRHLEAQQ